MEAQPTRPCPVCQTLPQSGDLIAPLPFTCAFTVAEGEREESDMFLCPECTLLFLSPLPSEAQLLAHYESVSDFGDPVYRDENNVKRILRFYSDRLGALLHLLPSPLPRGELAILEVGAGLAWLSRAAKQRLPHSRTVATDVAGSVVEECVWVDHYFIEDVITGRSVDRLGPFDVISLTHVIEHLPEPVDMIERLSGLLAPGGIIFVTAPHRPVGWRPGDSIRVFREWSYNHTPAHLQYFNNKSYARLAEAVGLDLRYWDAEAEEGQAFEAWLSRPGG